ncbi:hypothetical protein SNE40_015680 [Patella caerulea]|uniref:Uncharacterized protein n=1 Tax=Patella caerulea TaxID=87958 RepID=A0AAN8JKF0_PATCE
MGSLSSKPEVLDTTPLKNGQSPSIRQLENDPRSPGFDRTPIVVDKTPDLTIIDPRSPTAGIVRTPIVNLLNEKDNRGLEDDSLLANNEKADFEGSEESGRVSDLSVSTELNSLSLSDVDESSNLLSIKEEKIGKKSKSKNQTKTQPKQLFPVLKKTVLMHGDVRRSPLSSVVIDGNSPRNIVQRKQTKKIDNARSCRPESNFCPSANKENMTEKY